MTEHDDKQVASVDAMANAEPSKGRRRLVKGAMLATPAVMTLMSGRLASAASTTCAEREGLNNGATLNAGSANVYEPYSNPPVVYRITTPNPNKLSMIENGFVRVEQLITYYKSNNNPYSTEEKTVYLDYETAINENWVVGPLAGNSCLNSMA
ncbi:MAG: hypothetical protein KDJ31_10400 [Candidatus Competibacteraceae bacterium]|mgnify:CR=1 FL=1|nr:hypothetical protein [Candidatus Competibacteraceae bacterium]